MWLGKYWFFPVYPCYVHSSTRQLHVQCRYPTVQSSNTIHGPASWIVCSSIKTWQLLLLWGQWPFIYTYKLWLPQTVYQAIYFFNLGHCFSSAHASNTCTCISLAWSAIRLKLSGTTHMYIYIWGTTCMYMHRVQFCIDTPNQRHILNTDDVKGGIVLREFVYTHMYIFTYYM